MSTCSLDMVRPSLQRTPLASGGNLNRRLKTAKYLFADSPSAVSGIFEGVQIERFAVQASERALRRVGSYPHNWDDCGSAAPQPAAVSRASAALTELYRVCSGAWLPPHISASEEGEITFEWWSGARKLTMYIGATSMEVLKVWGVDLNNEMESVVLRDATNFGPVWAWLHGD